MPSRGRGGPLASWDGGGKESRKKTGEEVACNKGNMGRSQISLVYLCRQIGDSLRGEPNPVAFPEGTEME